jgi:hypothetical protein
MLLLLTTAACGGLANDPNPRLGISRAAKGAPGGGGGGVGGGGGGGGGTQIPPPPTIDGPSQFLYDASGVGAPGADIDFGAMANTAPGGIPIGNTRTAREFVYNTSKKTPLSISSISIVGADPQDFSVTVAPTAASSITLSSMPPNQNAFIVLLVKFTPTDAGTRTGTLQIVSNAGVATANLTGVGISLDPAMPSFAPLTFLPDSAPDTLTITNTGGSTLILQSLSIAGANVDAFTFTVANAGQSNCFNGIALAPQALCLLGIGVAPGVAAPASATLVILSNDPASPETDVSLTLLPAPTPTP